MPTTKSRKWLRWVIAAVIAVVVLVVAVPFIYINFIEDDPAPRLQLSTPSTSTPRSSADGTGTPSTLTGTWKVGSGSKAQYRVDEVLFGQDNTATGSTEEVTGEVVFDDTTVKTADMSVDLASVKSDNSRRDNQFNGRIMNTAQFPTATFTLTSPIELESVPAENTPITVQASGDLTLHGVTKPVTIELKAQRIGDSIEVNGTFPVTFADYGIPNPSFAGISVKGNGEFEFLLKLNQT